MANVSPANRDHAIQRALSPNPHERYATVNEFLAALAEPSAGARVPWSRARLKLLVGGVIAVALSVTIWQVVARQRQPTVQPGFAIMPFRASEAAANLSALASESGSTAFAEMASNRSTTKTV